MTEDYGSANDRAQPLKRCGSRRNVDSKRASDLTFAETPLRSSGYLAAKLLRNRRKKCSKRRS